jgi:hypothetical protein
MQSTSVLQDLLLLILFRQGWSLSYDAISKLCSLCFSLANAYFFCMFVGFNLKLLFRICCIDLLSYEIGIGFITWQSVMKSKG